MKTIPLSTMLGLFLLPVFAAAADFEAIPNELAQQLAIKLSEEAGKIEKTKFKVDADSEKASGVHIPSKVGALIVPQKGLKESEELAAKFKMDPGATLAYLFVYHMVPVVDGKRVDADKLHSVAFTDNNGGQHDLHVLLLSVRQLADDDYRLYVFGKDAKPLVDVKFAEGTGPGPTPTAVELKDPNEAKKEGKLVVTVFGKFQATFPAAYTGE
jgi:hypothetical protein